MRLKYMERVNLVDDTLKLFALESFSKPLAVAENLPAAYAQ
jgi:hypothetical protein